MRRRLYLLDHFGGLGLRAAENLGLSGDASLISENELEKNMQTKMISRA